MLFVVIDRRGYDLPDVFGPFPSEEHAENYARNEVAEINSTDELPDDIAVLRLHLPTEPGIRTVVYRWDTERGDCYDCGNPAAYTSDEHASSPENLRCSTCAAYDAAHGAKITYLYSEGDANA